MPDVFTGQEFAKRLSTGQLKKSIVKVGMAKTNDDSPNTILFAEGRMCAEWISIPVSVIEQVTLLGNVTCRDHEHPLVAIRFKEPDPKNETARVFAELVRRGPHTQPVQWSTVARADSGRPVHEVPVETCIEQCVLDFQGCLHWGGHLDFCMYWFGKCLGVCARKGRESTGGMR